MAIIAPTNLVGPIRSNRNKSRGSPKVARRLISQTSSNTLTKHHEIADALTNEILSERFRPGERLPSERDLAARFDANRGAVREAMKKVAQMGLATIQPGGARVEPLQHASLDVIGRMLCQNDGPNPHLVAEVLEVVNSLAQVAVTHVISHANDAQIQRIRDLITPLVSRTQTHEEHAIARMELLRAIMLTSNHLVCQIIARSLFEQLIPMVEGRSPSTLNAAEHRELLSELDRALATRDAAAAREVLRQTDELNRANVFASIVGTNEASIVEVSI